MPELRQNWATKEWVVMATERAKRPEELCVKREHKELPHYSETCPFCPGNEHLAPPPVMQIDNGKSWAVRVVPNKFPALAREGDVVRKVIRSRRTISGIGIHDVIVESTDHAANTAKLPVESVLNILQAYRRRYLAVCEDKRIAHITIFKNHGINAGTSLEHPHSQLIATPVISHQVRQRIYEALRHYDEYGECMFCEELREELEDGSRIAEVSKHFVVLAPFASPSPFSLHIVPRRHMASFGDINFEELTDLAGVLRNTLAKLCQGLDDPDYNYTIRSSPVDSHNAAFYHWYLSVIPRLTRVAGFELGSGMFINTVLPEDVAKFLREFQLEMP